MKRLSTWTSHSFAWLGQVSAAPDACARRHRGAPPSRLRSGSRRGVVAEGPVGAHWAGRFRMFRYEIRLWRGGHIPDVAEAIESPKRLSDDEHRARRVLDAVAGVPTPVCGRDELGTSEMWKLEFRDRVGGCTVGHGRRVDPRANPGPSTWAAGRPRHRRQTERGGRPEDFRTNLGFRQDGRAYGWRSAV